MREKLNEIEDVGVNLQRDVQAAAEIGAAAEPAPTERAETCGAPFSQNATRGRNPGWFVAGRPGPALKTGEHSRLVRSGIVNGQGEAMAGARRELRKELGDLGIVKASLADAFVELDAVRNYLGGRLGAESPLTTKGRQRALLTAYLGVVDRQVRLAQVLGIERRARRVADTLEAVIAAQPEAQ